MKFAIQRLSPPAVKRERGAAAVEMAIVIPLLFLVVAGIIDFGRFFFLQIQLTNAAREGARAAMVMAPNATVGTRASAAAAGVPSPTVNVLASCTSGSTANASVRVQAPFSWIILKPMMSVMGNKTFADPAFIAATGVMRCGG
jgi:hypothetical protein